MAGHCDVKTFGAGVLHSRDRWRSLFRQALTGGLLETNHARGGALGLTEKGWEVVQGKRKVAVTAPPTRSAPSLAPVRAHSPEGLPAARIALWGGVRMLRRRIGIGRAAWGENGGR